MNKSFRRSKFLLEKIGIFKKLTYLSSIKSLREPSFECHLGN